MASKILIALVALFVVTMAFEFEDEEEFDVEFMKRDPALQEYWMAEKRGRAMKKYKACDNLAGCMCSRRSNKVAFCQGAGTGDI